MKYHRHVIVVGGLVALTACGGSGTEQVNPGPFFMGAAEGDASPNGLPFASSGTSIDSVIGEESTVAVVRYVNNDSEGTTDVDLTGARIRVDLLTLPGGSAIGFDGEIEIDGDTIAVIDRDGTAGNGSSFRVYNYANDVHSAALGYGVFVGGPDSDFSEGFFVLGNQTDPATIGAAVGRATYTGELNGYGTAYNEAGDSSYASIYGPLELIADFDTSEISGTIDWTINVRGAFNEMLDIDVSVDPVSITGNGFVASSTEWTNCPTGQNCTSDMTLTGAFYGPNGEELSGVSGFNLTRENPDTGELLDITGAGGFTTATP